MSAATQQAIWAALGMCARQTTCLHEETWTVFRRRRWFFTSLPAATTTHAPDRRPAPWDAGWSRPLGAVDPLAPLDGSQASERGQLIPPATWPSPLGLLCRDGSAAALLTADQLRRFVKARMPEELRTTWQWLCSPRGRGRPSRLREVTRWLIENGPDHGVRLPTTDEVARAQGVQDLVAHLRLAPSARIEALEGACDADALLAHARAPLAACLLATPTPGQTRWPPMPEIRRRWQSALRTLTQNGASPAALVTPDRISVLIAAQEAAGVV